MRLFRRQSDREPDTPALRTEAERGRALVEESRELVFVLDDRGHVVAASRRIRETIDGLHEGAQFSGELLSSVGEHDLTPIRYEVGGRTETLMYLGQPGTAAAYEELRAGFTAAVSHELRTPLARLLALIENAALPDFEPEALVVQARREIQQIKELIDDVLFLSELETGRAVVSLGSTAALPHLREALEALSEQAERAGVTLVVDGDDEIELPLRPRMLRVLGRNLAENAIRHAGEGAMFRLSVVRTPEGVALEAADDGAGVDPEDARRLFERFYRTDRARATRGTGLGLAIVKHVVTSAGGTVEASGAPGGGLVVRCQFPA